MSKPNSLEALLLPMIRCVTPPREDLTEGPSHVYGDAEPFLDDRLDDLFQKFNDCTDPEGHEFYTVELSDGTNAFACGHGCGKIERDP